MKQIEVQIMGQSYLLGCPEGGEARLREAAPELADDALALLAPAERLGFLRRLPLVAGTGGQRVDLAEVGTYKGAAQLGAELGDESPPRRFRVAAELATPDLLNVGERLRHRGGEHHWVLARALPVRDDDGHIVRWLGTFTDIHDQKRAQQALLDSNRQKDEFLATLAHELRNPLAPLRNGLEILQRAPGDRQEAFGRRDRRALCLCRGDEQVLAGDAPISVQVNHAEASLAEAGNGVFGELRLCYFYRLTRIRVGSPSAMTRSNQAVRIRVVADDLALLCELC